MFSIHYHSRRYITEAFEYTKNLIQAPHTSFKMKEVEESSYAILLTETLPMRDWIGRFQEFEKAKLKDVKGLVDWGTWIAALKWTSLKMHIS